MWLLTGLGNPGKQYAHNRHNIGFMAADRLAQDAAAAPYSSKFNGHLTEARIGNERVLLLKPQTYMNLSGQSVGEALRFYKIPVEKLIVVHDELDLPLGKLRVKRGGGNGGHNGLKSIDAHAGPDYLRLRLGIAHPGDREQVSNHVLSDFGKEEQPVVSRLLEAVSRHFPLLMAGDDAGFMNKVTLETRVG